MRTDDLICMMAKNPPVSCAKRFAFIWGGVALMFAVLVAAVYFVLDFRPGLSFVFEVPDMMFKYAFLSAVTIGSGIAWWYSGHPGRNYRISYYGLIFLAVLLGLMALRAVFIMPFEELRADILNTNAFTCLGFIALSSVAGSYVLTMLTGCMAPVNCRLHAVFTGLFATSLGALAYGLHCPHDNPVYLALWYGGTTIAVTMAILPLLMKKQAW